MNHGRGMRRCRYRGQPKAHLQHVLTDIAVNIERFSGLSSADGVLRQDQAEATSRSGQIHREMENRGTVAGNG
ncbi:transposase [Streptomyces sp. NPDC058469]|uniref:transposase n=1 Tax=Streptomyces sp. NPDC058469 TaxID=3346514 RepID=UPI003667AD62